MSRFIYMVHTALDLAYSDEYKEWQETEHLPWLLGVPGYLNVRRLVSEDNPAHYLNVWTLESKDNFYSPVKQQVSNSPWSVRLRKHRSTDIKFFNQLSSDGDESTITDNLFSCVLFLPPRQNPFLSLKADNKYGIKNVHILESDETFERTILIEYLYARKDELLQFLHTNNIDLSTASFYKMLPVPDKKVPMCNDGVQNVWPKK